MHLVVRFVLDDPAQLARALGVPEADLDDVVVGWLAELVRSVTVR